MHIHRELHYNTYCIKKKNLSQQYGSLHLYSTVAARGLWAGNRKRKDSHHWEYYSSFTLFNSRDHSFIQTHYHYVSGGAGVYQGLPTFLFFFFFLNLRTKCFALLCCRSYVIATLGWKFVKWARGDESRNKQLVWKRHTPCWGGRKGCRGFNGEKWQPEIN